mmetsp:Transcript_25651/g.54774  ORF Transcript_25651/g.54774 Transcript_25651/m.54774 type:complete len:239 (+) Transcript_25651:40-756(+)
MSSSNNHNNNKKGCLCAPYKDAFVITAQIVSIFAFLISWIWWATFLSSVIALIMLQCIWCCRQNRAGFMVSAAFSLIAAITNVYSGIFILSNWDDAHVCLPFALEHFNYDDIAIDYGYDYDDDYEQQYMDLCFDHAYANIAFFDGALWLLVAGCTLCFEFSGRHAALDKRWSDQNTSTSDENVATVAVEMGTVEQNRAPSATVTAAATANVPVARAMLMPDNNSCIPPAEVSKKAEEA